MLGQTNIENFDTVYSKVYMNTNGGDASYSSYIPFNTIEVNIGNGTWDNGKFIIPIKGLYIAIFSNYSNSAGSGRATIFHLDSSGTTLESEFNNGNYSTSLTGIFLCEKGEMLAAGGLNSSFAISIYKARSHNVFTVLRLK